jgi:hypothetical protein
MIEDNIDFARRYIERIGQISGLEGGSGCRW